MRRTGQGNKISVDEITCQRYDFRTTPPTVAAVGRRAPSGALAFSSHSKLIRTIVYIDGFNFYYGELKGTSWKWLDPVALFQKVLGSKNHIVKIKYFTARIQSIPTNPGAHNRQDAYLQALRAYCPIVEIHYGDFLRHKISMEHAEPPPTTVRVWKNEEKGSDVNLAIHVLNDAWLNAYDCAIIVSNDSDLAGPLKLVKAWHQKTIGLVTPGAPVRKTSKQLKIYADFIKPIRTWALQASQLPNPIPGINLPKPVTW